jgi:ribosomal-protein-alanine N-acetyltransferase
MTAEARKALVPTFPVLTTERLVLREFRDDDAPWYLEQFSRPEIVEGQGYAAPVGLAGALDEMHHYGIDLFRAGNGIRWAICPKDASTPIGSCIFLDWQDEPVARVELGYSLDPAWWGQGFAGEALRAIQRFGFEVMRLQRIEALVWTANERSLKLLDRLGYVREELLHASFEDSTGFLRDEWRLVLTPPHVGSY